MKCTPDAAEARPSEKLDYGLLVEFILKISGSQVLLVRQFPPSSIRFMCLAQLKPL